MLQVNSAYYASGASRVMNSIPLANQGYQTPPVLNAPYQSCDRYESRVANPGHGTDTYQTYGVGGPYHHPDIERRNLIPGGGTSRYQSGMVEPYPRPSFSTYGEHTGFPELGISRASQSTSVPNLSPTYSTYLSMAPFFIVLFIYLSGVVQVFKILASQGGAFPKVICKLHNQHSCPILP